MVVELSGAADCDRARPANAAGKANREAKSLLVITSTLT
jgi:hypothetical protein